ncbi:MAG: hypothetical protein ACJ71U_20340 [Terriglobales bacterium]
MTQEAKIEDFWKWFSGVAASLAFDVENSLVLEDLDKRLLDLDPMLSWEIGPGSSEPLQLVISPNLDLNLLPTARKIISAAPVLDGWEFYSARRPKNWDYKLLMERSEGTSPIQLDASGWSFVLLQYPDGAREVLLSGKDLPELNDDERWQAAAMTLESILGEEELLNRISEFELVNQLEARFAAKERPIQQLREAVLG